jgi:uroporphyrinogen decarboxylase
VAGGNVSTFGEFVGRRAYPFAMPIATYPGARLVGCSVADMVTDAGAQHAASAALQDTLATAVSLTAMDLSVEAEAFGAEVRMARDEVPTVIGRCVSSTREIDDLVLPSVGTGRTSVPLGAPLIFGGLIGPFSLAGRLFGVTESLELTIQDPAATRALLDKVTQFLCLYAAAFRDAGAHGVLMAEPTAGLLSPRALTEFSSTYVRRICAAVEDGRFGVVLHNCGARKVHIPSILTSGVQALHFGAPVNIPEALASVPTDVIVCGNLDPSAAFVGSSSDEVHRMARALVLAAAGRSNFVLSSGCDVPHSVPIETLRAFVAAATPGPSGLRAQG